MVTTTWKIRRFVAGKWEESPDPVAIETTATLYVEGHCVGKIHFLPKDRELLVLGHLFLAGLIENPDELTEIFIDEGKNEVRVTRRATPGTTSTLVALDPTLPKISPATITRLAATLAENSLFRQTGAVHCGLIARQTEVLYAAEDTGRFNVLDKLTGFILREKLPNHELIVTFSGRFTGEIVSRLAKIKIPVGISPAAPTTQGIEIAAAAGITLIGFARGDRFNVYTHAQRVEG